MHKLTRLCALAATLLVPAAASAQNITYSVNRTIGNGSVVGTVVTDGTVGILASANILNWTFALSSPNMVGGGEVISGIGVGIGGSGLVASTSALTFDFAPGTGSFFFLQGASGNAWCMSAGPLSCSGEPTPSEGIYFNVNGSGPAEVISPTGIQTIATAVTQVPEPATASLLLLAVASLGMAARRRSRAA